MERIQVILQGSILWRLLDGLCCWVGRQWSRSGVVQWFLHPSQRVQGASESSIFYRIFLLLHRGLAALYRMLHLEKLFAGSIFTCTVLWGALPVVFAPFLPTLLVLGLVLIGFCSLALSFARDGGRKLYYAPMNRWLYGYVAVYLVASWFSASRGSSLKVGVLTAVFVLFAVVLENAVSTRKQLDWIVRLMVLAGTLVALYGICQYLFGWGYQSEAWVDSDMFSTITFRVASTFENPNMLGQYFILIIPLGGACLLSGKDWASRILWLGCCGILCVCMILTFSRGAWLGLLLAGLVFFLLLNPRLILLAPVALVALYFVMPESVIGRFTSIGNLGDQSTSYRVAIWMGVLAMLKEYWLCGIGPGEGAFNLVYPAYSYNAVTALHTHNLYLQILCDAGICGLVVFGLILFQYFRHLCAALTKEKDRTSRVFQIAAISGVCGFLVQAMTDYSFYNYRVMFLFWAFLAIGTLLAGRSALPERRERQ